MEEATQTSGGVIETDLKCRGCGYNLRGLDAAGGNCPECGEKWLASLWSVEIGTQILIDLECVGCGQNLRGMPLSGTCARCGYGVRDSVLEQRKGVKVDRKSLRGFILGAMLTPVWLGVLAVFLNSIGPLWSWGRIISGLLLLLLGVLDVQMVTRDGKPVVPYARVHQAVGLTLVALGVVIGGLDGRVWLLIGVCYLVWRLFYLTDLMAGMGMAEKNKDRLAVLFSFPIQVMALWWHADNGYKRGWTKLTGDEARADREALVEATVGPGPWEMRE